MSHAIARIVLIVFLPPVFTSGCTRNSTPQEQTPIAATPAAPSTSSSRQKAIRAYIDPVTGQLRDPTPEELATEAAEQATKEKTNATTQSQQQKPREVVLPDGTVEITLDESTRHPLQACIQNNGEVKMDHECKAQSGGAKSEADKP